MSTKPPRSPHTLSSTSASTSTTSPLETHAHTALIVAAFIASFDNLVRDPDTTLTRTLPILSLVQSAYAVRCLRTLNPTARKREVLGLSSKMILSFLATLFSATVGTLAIYILLILFGAPLTTHAASTILCAAHVGMLVVAPLVYKYRLDGRVWREVLGVRAPVDEVFAGAVGALVGGWFGAVPIPLDWDREWQKWPVTILTGAYVGYVLGKSLGWAFPGKRLPL